MEKHLTILKKLHDKNVTLMKNNPEMCRTCQKKLISINFSKALIIPLMGSKVRPFNSLKNYVSKLQQSFLVLETFLSPVKYLKNPATKTKLNHTIC